MDASTSPRRVALTREVPDSLARCELTHLARAPLDVSRARAQHRAYEDALRALDCAIVRLPAEHGLPDSVFVEDTAVVLDELAVLTRPGAPSRQAEVDSVAPVLALLRPLRRLAPPATLDGGDVLRLGRMLYVGVGARSNEAGLAQLAALAGEAGYEVRGVTFRGCLHLKSAVTEPAPGRLLVNPDWIDPSVFDGHDVMTVDPAEPFAANVLRVGEAVVCAASHPRTTDRLRAEGLTVHPIDISELAKAEGAVTCCSLMLVSFQLPASSCQRPASSSQA